MNEVCIEIKHNTEKKEEKKILKAEPKNNLSNKPLYIYIWHRDPMDNLPWV